MTWPRRRPDGQRLPRAPVTGIANRVSAPRDPDAMAPAHVVSSTRNPRIRAAAALLLPKGRDRQGRYLVEGPRFAADVLAGGELEELFALPGAAEVLTRSAAQAGVDVTLVTEGILRRLADSVHPQGVVGVARQRHARLATVVGTGFIVVLCGVADPGNAGTAIRSAAAAGATAVVLTTGSVDPWNPKAVRASAGSVARLPLVVGAELAEVVEACRGAGQRLVALHAAATRSIDDPGALDPPVALLFGSEAHGLPPAALDAVDQSISVPRYGPVESLNLAAAVAVTVYAAARAAHGGPG